MVQENVAGLRDLVETARRRTLAESSKERKFKDYTLYAYAAPGRNEWSVEAYLGKFERKVGRAEFAGVYEYPRETDDDAAPSETKLVALKGWDVEVHPDHRRQGLSSAMYKFASEAFKLPIQPGDFQTGDGAAFLKNRKTEAKNGQSACCIVEDDQGRVLLLQRGDTAPWMPGKWNLPGGGVDEGESPERAAVREAQEEVSIQVSDLKLLVRAGIPGLPNEELFVYHTMRWSGTPRLDHENTAMEWATKKAAPMYDLVPPLAKILRKLS